MIPKKSLGQNFLMHARIAERMVMEAGITEKDTVLEIGPGTGMLTRVLLARAKRVIAVEADDALIPILKETFATELKEKQLELIHGDIRTYDPQHISGSYKLVANIPYYITGEIVRMFLTTKKKPASITLLVQKEVAVRICRAKKESMLSLSVKTFGTPRFCFTVPRGAFVPAPNVDSAVLSITNVHNPFATQKEEGRFFNMVKAGFAHKRKFLLRNLEDIAPLSKILDAFEALDIPKKSRAEDLALIQWHALVKNLL